MAIRRSDMECLQDAYRLGRVPAHALDAVGRTYRALNDAGKGWGLGDEDTDIRKLGTDSHPGGIDGALIGAVRGVAVYRTGEGLTLVADIYRPRAVDVACNEAS